MMFAEALALVAMQRHHVWASGTIAECVHSNKVILKQNDSGLSKKSAN